MQVPSVLQLYNLYCYIMDTVDNIYLNPLQGPGYVCTSGFSTTCNSLQLINRLAKIIQLCKISCIVLMSIKCPPYLKLLHEFWLVFLPATLLVSVITVSHTQMNLGDYNDAINAYNLTLSGLINKGALSGTSDVDVHSSEDDHTQSPKIDIQVTIVTRWWHIWVHTMWVVGGTTTDSLFSESQYDCGFGFEHSGKYTSVKWRPVYGWQFQEWRCMQSNTKRGVAHLYSQAVQQRACKCSKRSEHI